MGIAYILQDNSILIQWMGRKINSYQITLLVETFQISPCRCRNYFGSRYFYLVLTAKQRVGCGSLIHLIFISIAYQYFRKSFIFGILHKEIFTLDAGKTVKRTCQSQIFNILTVTSREVYTLNEIKDIFIFSVSLPFLQNRVNSTFSYALDGS